MLENVVENKKNRTYDHPRSIWRCITVGDHDRYRHRVAVQEERIGVDHTWSPSNHWWWSHKLPSNDPSNRRPKAWHLYLVASVQPSRSGSASPSRDNRHRRIRGRRLEPHRASNYEDKRIILALISQLGPTRTRTRRTRGGSKTCMSIGWKSSSIYTPSFPVYRLIAKF